MSVIMVEPYRSLTWPLLFFISSIICTLFCVTYALLLRKFLEMFVLLSIFRSIDHVFMRNTKRRISFEPHTTNPIYPTHPPTQARIQCFLFWIRLTVMWGGRGRGLMQIRKITLTDRQAGRPTHNPPPPHKTFPLQSSIWVPHLPIATLLATVACNLQAKHAMITVTVTVKMYIFPTKFSEMFTKVILLTIMKSTNKLINTKQ
jgi:hypothetical protein